jgi:hypothetical protein
MFGKGYHVLFPDLFHGFLHEDLHFGCWPLAKVQHFLVIQFDSNICCCREFFLYTKNKRILSLEDMIALLRRRMQLKLKYCYCYLIHVLKKCLHCQWIPSLARFIFALIVQVKGYHIFELLQRNFANALDFEKIMHKVRLDMIQFN